MLGEPEKNKLNQPNTKPGQSGFFYVRTNGIRHEQERRKALGL